MSNETTALQTIEPTTAVVVAPTTRISQALAVLREAKAFADMLASSSFVPQAYRGNAGDIMACVAFGQRVGLDPFSSLQGIAVINGRPSIWGDAALAVCRAHPEWGDIEEVLDRSGAADSWRALCRVTRRGQTPTERTFSVGDARRAGLWAKAGPWTAYPQRMLQMRARAWALRDAFADALTGIAIGEESADLPPDPGPVAFPRDALPEGQRTRVLRLRQPEPAVEEPLPPVSEPGADPEPEPPPAGEAESPPPAGASWRDPHANDWPFPACPDCHEIASVHEVQRATGTGGWECQAPAHGSRARRFHRATEAEREEAMEAVRAYAAKVGGGADAALDTVCSAIAAPADPRCWSREAAAEIRDECRREAQPAAAADAAERLRRAVAAGQQEEMP